MLHFLRHGKCLFLAIPGSDGSSAGGLLTATLQTFGNPATEFRSSPDADMRPGDIQIAVSATSQGGAGIASRRALGESPCLMWWVEDLLRRL